MLADILILIFYTSSQVTNENGYKGIHSSVHIFNGST